MFKKFVLFLLVAVGVLAAVVAMQPADFRVSRSATMAAPAATVFEQVNDFHKWEAWSPWAKLDPKAQNTFEGPSSGKGAIFKWSGNDEVGVGQMTITESRPTDLVLIQLDFLKPFEATSQTEFTFKPTPDGKTAVSWTMTGKNNFIGKAFSLVMDCEKMVGPQFDQGLENMRKIVETPAAN
jgi:uncharacterized protein YndB with AHSA1/START domain